jgi:hypothetical protein
MITGQITIGTTKVQFPQIDFAPQFMTVINAGGTGTVNVGDVTVDATLNTVRNGVPLTPGGSFTFQLGQDYSTRLSEFWAISSATGSTLNYILI